MIGDTIVALASAAGPGARAVLRLSGPSARRAAARVFSPELAARRAQVEGTLAVGAARVPALALVMVSPASFTGEDTVELHLPGSPLLVELTLAALLEDGAAQGVRMALPGEFTARACRNGRLDLAAAEGLLLLLHAQDRHAAAAALPWLQGAAGRSVQDVRAALQDALALLEAGLDFTDGETGEVATAVWTAPLASLPARLADLLASVPIVAPGGDVLLLGRANVGKSSLANALAGGAAALVSDRPGTTRDLVRCPLPSGAVLWDAPGDLDAPAEVDAAALQLRDRLAGGAAAALWLLDATAPVLPPAVVASPLPCLAVVWTKCDLVAAPPPLPAAIAAHLPVGVAVLATSSVRGVGIPALAGLLARTARGGAVGAGGPLRAALQSAGDAVARALAAAGVGPELAAVELQTALRALDGLGGAHTPEALLDRIYGRFCLGK